MAGPKGPAGSQGATGLRGPSGAAGPAGPAGAAGGINAKRGEFLIPAWDKVQVSNLGKFQDDCFKTVSWTIDALNSAGSGNHAGMTITYRFDDLNQTALSNFVQAINRYSDSTRCKVNFSINLKKVTSKSVTVNIVRMDSEKVWSDTFSFHYSMFF